MRMVFAGTGQESPKDRPPLYLLLIPQNLFLTSLHFPVPNPGWRHAAGIFLDVEGRKDLHLVYIPLIQKDGHTENVKPIKERCWGKLILLCVFFF